MNVYFASRVDVISESGCWEWKLSRRPGGYGQARHRVLKRPVGAHRLSYELHVGPIPAGLTVDHLCFNPPCVNPDHLRLLTRSQNSANQRDAYKTHCKRGHDLTPENTRVKLRNGKRDCKRCHAQRERVSYSRRVVQIDRPGLARGERVASARLTAGQVAQIKSRAATETTAGLAREFGVSRGAIQGIVYGRTWRHIEATA